MLICQGVLKIDNSDLDKQSMSMIQRCCSSSSFAYPSLIESANTALIYNLSSGTVFLSGGIKWTFLFKMDCEDKH